MSCRDDVHVLLHSHACSVTYLYPVTQKYMSCCNGVTGVYVLLYLCTRLVVGLIRMNMYNNTISANFLGMIILWYKHINVLKLFYSKLKLMKQNIFMITTLHCTLISTEHVQCCNRTYALAD